jgi:N-acetyl-anhydromuramyl-L-alanine amidase AmpD
VQQEGWTVAALAEHEDQFVIHYDVCGTSRQCFKVLQDIRGLSVHFMLDVDGTVYQTLDLKERAWHAGIANDRSVGIEIAHIGAYPRAEHRTLNEWYVKDGEQVRVRFPAWMKETGIRTAGFVARPERAGLIEGEIHGVTYWQHDFTAEQYAALVRLTAALHRVLPKVRLDVPRDAAGKVRGDALTVEERGAWSGLLGHWHVTEGKQDPGPAFDWERVLQEARGLVGE